ncbi:MAG: tRNA-dependent cyclodipeptide synthase [Rhodanobacteraceae bacterium]
MTPNPSIEATDKARFARFGLRVMSNVMPSKQESTVSAELVTVAFTCPSCGQHTLESTQVDVYTVEYACPNCGAVVKPSAEDDCVFCSYGKVLDGNLSCAQEMCSGVRCLPERNERAYVTLGISPFNSYYSEAHLTGLLSWSASRFDHICAFLPDIPTVWTLEAGGYSSHDASRKTKRQIRYLTNKIARAASDAKVPDQAITILPWSTMSNMDKYQELHQRCEVAFKADVAFRKACLETTDEVLIHRRRDGYVPDGADRGKAVDYLMAELPLILFGSTLMNTPTSTFVYHKPPELFERMFAGEFTILPAIGQHFVIATEQQRNMQYTQS